jgi:hypothetical protein
VLDSDAFRLVERLCEAGVEFCVVGGLAAVLLGAPVMTRDLDIVHRRTDENVDRLALLLDAIHATPRTGSISPTAGCPSSERRCSAAGT